MGDHWAKYDPKKPGIERYNVNVPIWYSNKLAALVFMEELAHHEYDYKFRNKYYQIQNNPSKAAQFDYQTEKYAHEIRLKAYKMMDKTNLWGIDKTGFIESITTTGNSIVEFSGRDSKGNLVCKYRYSPYSKSDAEKIFKESKKRMVGQIEWAKNEIKDLQSDIEQNNFIQFYNNYYNAGFKPGMPIKP